jgi:NitT/TauT family transport system substrate-binding protein
MSTTLFAFEADNAQMLSAVDDQGKAERGRDDMLEDAVHCGVLFVAELSPGKAPPPTDEARVPAFGFHSMRAAVQLRSRIGMGLMRSLLVATCIAALPATDGAFAADRLRVGEEPCLCGGAFFIAREKGYFNALNLAIEATRFEDEASALSALAAGELDLALTPMQARLFNTVAAGTPLAIILDAGSNRRGFGGTAISVAQTLHEGGLHAVADFVQLKGRRFAVPALGGIHHYNAARALRKAKLDPASDVQWVASMSQAEIVRLLAVNAVDAADLAYPYAWLAQSSRSAPIVLTDDQLVPDAAIAAFAARRDVLATRRDAVVRFAMAYLHAGAQFNAAARDPAAHPDIVDILARSAALPSPDVLSESGPNWSFMAEDGAPPVASIMEMQEFWGGKYFRLVERQASRAQLFELGVAKQAKARLDKEKPFKN